MSELPQLYSSCFCMCEYFLIYDQPENVHVCCLDDPRHVVIFTVKGRTADVLNKLIDIEPECVERVAEAIFRARPDVKRIRAEIKFPPAALRRSARELYRADDMVVQLPSTEDDYLQMIGKTTRKHLRQYGNQLRRKCPEFRVCTFEKDAITQDLVEKVAEWNRQRMRLRGIVSRYEHEPEAVGKLWRLLQGHGVAVCGFNGEDCVAGQLLLAVGSDVWVHTVGFDSHYEDVHLGLLMTSYSIIEGARRGCERVHLTWGTTVYKERLGAVPVTAYRVALYRSPAHKLLYARELAEIAIRDRQRLYYTARKKLKSRLFAAAGKA